MLEKIELDEAAFKEEEGTILQRLRQEHQSGFFGNYLQHAMDQLRQDQQLVINQEMVDVIVGI